MRPHRTLFDVRSGRLRVSSQAVDYGTICVLLTAHAAPFADKVAYSRATVSWKWHRGDNDFTRVDTQIEGEI